jgi:surface polysaccharide O-acyltransferase-like enzyme
MIETTNKKVNHNINLLKIIACFAVIVLHTSAEYVFEVEYGTLNSMVLNFGHGITRFAVTCFFLISGSLYLDKSYRIKDKKKFFLRIGHYVFLYFFYAVFYSGCAILFSKQLERNLIKDVFMIFEHALFNPKYHLWYLPAYIGVLFAIPILKRFIGDGKDGDEKYIIKYALLFMLINMVFTSLDVFQIGILNNAVEILQPFLINTFAKWIGVCLLGYYINNHFNEKYKVIYLFGILLFVVSLIASYFYYGRIETGFYDNLRFQTTLYSCIVFDFVVKRCKLSFSERTFNRIDYLSGLTLGIYLIHPFLLNIFDVVGFNSIMCNSSIAILIVAITTFIISAIIVAIVKKIPVLRRLME